MSITYKYFSENIRVGMKPGKTILGEHQVSIWVEVKQESRFLFWKFNNWILVNDVVDIIAVENFRERGSIWEGWPMRMSYQFAGYSEHWDSRDLNLERRVRELADEYIEAKRLNTLAAAKLKVQLEKI